MNIITLIHERSYIGLALILCIYSVCWFIQFKLCFKLVDEKMPPLRRIVWGPLILVAYAVFGRPFIPNIIFLILMCVLMIISLQLFGRMGIFKSIYSAIIAYFISSLGNIFVLWVLLGLYPKLFPSIFTTKLGIFFGSAIEVLFPLLALYVFPKLKFSLRLPVKDKSDPYDFIDLVMLWTFGCMFYFIDYSLMAIVDAFKKDPRNIVSALKFLFIASFGIFGGVIVILNAMKKWYGLLKNRYKLEQQKREEEQRRREEERQRFELTINELETQNREIKKLNETLKTLKMEPIKLANDFESVVTNGLNVISQIKDYYKKLETSGYIIIQPDKLLEYNLNANEKAVLESMMAGKTFQEIGDVMNFVEGTVKNIASQIYKKFGVKSRKELEEFVLKNLINLD